MSKCENKKQSSARRIAASRANGAKSHGPVTSEGKAKSRLNSTKHGCLASLLTFTPEDHAAFKIYQEQYVHRFQPRDQVEYDLVEQIAYCNYQMRHAWTMQAAVLHLQMRRDKETVEMEFGPDITDAERMAAAYIESGKESNAIANFQRYQRSLSNQAAQATKQLMAMQQLRLPPAPTEELQHEPNPTIEHPETTPELVPQSPESALTTDNRQLTTKLTTDHWPLTTTSAPSVPSEVRSDLDPTSTPAISKLDNLSRSV